MQVIKTFLLGLTAIIGIGASSSLGAHNLTRETIWDQKEVQENVLPANNKSLDNEWKQLSKDKPDLKNWCTNSYKSTYKSLFWSENKDLLKEVLEKCKLKIKDKLGEGNYFKSNEDQNKESLEKKVTLLKSDNDNTSISDFPELDEIRKDKTNTKNWSDLEKWCMKIYDQGFQGKEQNKWKLADKFCKKTSD